MVTLEARLATSQDPDERRQLLRRVAKMHEEQEENYVAALETTAKLLAEDPAAEGTWAELERLARVANAEGRLAEIFAIELEKITSDEPATARLAQRTGELFEMHLAARDAATRLSMRDVPHLFDVVVTTNSGFPLDQNLYQAVKGMSAAATVLKPGGMIVCAAECRDGFPDHGQYRELLLSQRSPRELINAIVSSRSVTPDQWQVQVQANIQTRATVVMYTDYLSDEELAQVHLGQTRDIAATVLDELDRRGPDATVCVLPEGPQTIPRLASG